MHFWDVFFIKSLHILYLNFFKVCVWNSSRNVFKDSSIFYGSRPVVLSAILLGYFFWVYSRDSSGFIENVVLNFIHIFFCAGIFQNSWRNSRRVFVEIFSKKLLNEFLKKFLNKLLEEFPDE